MVVDPLVITLAVTGGAFVLFATELLAPDVTALTAAAALMVTGVLTPLEGFSGFSNPATLTILSMFVIAAGVQRTGLVNVGAHWVLDVASGSSRKFMLLLLVFVGVVSGFLNNTPVVAILIPLVITVAGQLEVSPSKFLIPLSFAAILGGTLTLIGTSTNVLASGIADQFEGIEPFSMFLFTKVGIVLLAIGVGYLVLVGPMLLPDRHKVEQLTERFDLSEYVFEVEIQPHSPLAGETVSESALRRNFDIDIVRVFRGERSIEPPLGAVELAEHDVLLVRATREELLGIREAEGLAIRPEVSHGLPAESGETMLVEAIVNPGSELEGATLEEISFQQTYNAAALAIKKRERLFLRRIDEIRLKAGDTLLLSGAPEAIEALKRSPAFIIAEELDIEEYRRDRIPLVLAILVGVIGLAALNVFPISVAAFAGMIALVVTGCLQVHELHEAVRWDIVFLLAGVIPLGLALQKTGGARLIASAIVDLSSVLPAIGILAVFYAVTVFLTQIISNNASVALMLPVAYDAAVQLGLNELTFVLGVTFAASMGFLTPIGYQTNLMVYGPGEYKFRDFFRIGLPLTILLMVVNVWLLDVFWPLHA